MLDRLCGARWLGDPLFFRRGMMYLGLFHPTSRWPYPKVVWRGDPAPLRPPAILVATHLSAPEAMGALLERLPGEVAALVDRSWPRGGRVQRISLGRGEPQRVGGTIAALRTLGRPGFLFLAADGGSAKVEVTTLGGRRVEVARGAFELASLRRVPVVPVMPRWHGRKVEITIGEPLTPADPRAMALEFARWLERYLSEVGPDPGLAYGLDDWVRRSAAPAAPRGAASRSPSAESLRGA